MFISRFLVPFVAALGLVSTAPAATVQAVTHWSNALGQWRTYRVVLPAMQPGERLPVLYMLNPATGNSLTYINSTNLVQLVDEFRMIVVCPDGATYGWYLDSPVQTNFRFESYITQDVIAHVDSTFSTIPRREGRAVAGMSMGGHGAMILSTRNPQLYGSASSMAGILDIRNHPTKWEIYNRLGNLSQFPERWNTYSNVAQANALTASGVPRLFDCGLQDNVFTGVGALEDNRLMRDTLLARNHPFIYREFNGFHNYAYVTARLRDHFTFHQAHVMGATSGQDIVFTHYFNRMRSFYTEAAQNTVTPNPGFRLTLLGEEAAERFPSELIGVPVLNRGIAGDTMGVGPRGISRRLTESIFEAPSNVIVFESGRNDLINGVRTNWNPSFNRVVQEWETIVDSIRQRQPNSQLVITSTLPVGGEFAYLKDLVVSFNNQLRQKSTQKGLRFIDMHALMVGPDGLIRPEFTTDGFNLSRLGYEYWALALEEELGLPRPVFTPGAADITDFRTRVVRDRSFILEATTAGPATLTIDLERHPEVGGGLVRRLTSPLGTEHQLIVDGLTPSTRYQLSINSADAGGAGPVRPMRKVPVSTSAETGWLTRGFDAGEVYDLHNTALRFTPSDRGAGYSVAYGISGGFSPPPVSQSEVVVVGKNQSVEHVFQNGTFSFFQRDYDRVFVSSNGYLTFGAPDLSNDPSMHHLQPRISLLFGDVEEATSEGRNVRFFQWEDRFFFTLNGIRLVGESSVFNATAELNLTTGDILLRHHQNTTSPPLAPAPFVIGLSSGSAPVEALGSAGNRFPEPYFSDLVQPVGDRWINFPGVPPVFFDFTRTVEGFGAFFDTVLRPAMPISEGALRLANTRTPTAHYGAWATVIPDLPASDGLGSFSIRRISTRVTNSVLSPSDSVSLRVGTNSTDFSEGTLLVRNAVGSARGLPGRAPLEVAHYARVDHAPAGLIPSLQFLDENPLSPREQIMSFINLRMQTIRGNAMGQPIPEGTIFDLTQERSGWVFYTPAGFTPMTAISDEEGLGLVGGPPATGQTITYGSWVRTVTPEEFRFNEGHLIFATFVFEGLANDPARMAALPTVRARIDHVNWEVSSLKIIESTNPSNGIPARGATRSYSVLYAVPAGMDGEIHRIGFDSYHVAGDGNDPSVGVRLRSVSLQSLPKP